MWCRCDTSQYACKKNTRTSILLAETNLRVCVPLIRVRVRVETQLLLSTQVNGEIGAPK